MRPYSVWIVVGSRLRPSNKQCQARYDCFLLFVFLVDCFSCALNKKYDNLWITSLGESRVESPETAIGVLAM